MTWCVGGAQEGICDSDRLPNSGSARRSKPACRLPACMRYCAKSRPSEPERPERDPDLQTDSCINQCHRSLPLCGGGFGAEFELGLAKFLSEISGKAWLNREKRRGRTARSGYFILTPYWCIRLHWGFLRATIFPSRRSVAHQMTYGGLFMPVSFTQSCPTCGRRIQIRASLLGCIVGCQHCHAVFEAQEDCSGSRHEPEDPHSDPHSDPLMERVEQALNRANEATVVS